ncbi:sensor histidine kinase [Pseudemcibacter aquimaris]|uniref:sensor histidine kinase n=1 Tax=Pseudemcibacter aquimaris TaxID=2857064 RepID=UPI002012AD23|nr:ATP-binding protein [Pseudemcibacter aquimaris]MCC3861047.1 ATP-binding protein [Pseudemcibacter aquimaris]WDU59866.1 ATP-binding protein [Pseudemcibacter aquimaris]
MPDHLRNLNFHGDQIAIRRVFLNLLSNAVKFSPEVSEIICSIEEYGKDHIKIMVRDKGIGIPKEKIEEVLSPFGQVHEVKNLNQTGTGLGLPIVKELVELHGGEFTLESAVGTGTDAIILLPKEKFSV